MSSHELIEWCIQKPDPPLVNLSTYFINIPMLFDAKNIKMTRYNRKA